MDSAKEAAFYLNRIMEEGCTLTASFADHGRNASIMTTIADIPDDESGVIFEYSDSKELDSLIRQSQSIDFSTYIDDVSITFSSGPVEDTVYNDKPAFKIQMPRAIDRVQRRDFYRASPPVSERPTCAMEYKGKTYKAIVVDISIGGMSAFIHHADFKAGDVIEKCTISTPIGEIEAPLEIVYVGSGLDGNLKVQYGCRFKDISMLVESKLQKYVTYLQGLVNAKRYR